MIQASEECIGLKELNQEMKDKLETQEETIKVLVSEKNYLKKAYDTQIKKLKDI